MQSQKLDTRYKDKTKLLVYNDNYSPDDKHIIMLIMLFFSFLKQKRFKTKQTLRLLLFHPLQTTSYTIV